MTDDLEAPAPPEEQVLLRRQSSEDFSSLLELNVTESFLLEDLSWRETRFFNFEQEIGTN